MEAKQAVADQKAAALKEKQTALADAKAELKQKEDALAKAKESVEKLCQTEPYLKEKSLPDRRLFL